MKSKLEISSDAGFTLFLIPETEAERDILKRVAEQRTLMSHWDMNGSHQWYQQFLQVYPVIEQKDSE